MRITCAICLSGLFTSRMITGTVSITEKNPAENVIVQLETMSDTWTYGIPDPSSLFFQQLGTQSFNLTVYLKEDVPPGGVYQLSIRAFASSTLDSADDNRQLLVIPTWYLAAEATLLEEPRGVVPGSTVSGVVEILNTGSRYSDYFLVVAEDPDDVIEKVVFNQPVELGPNMLEKAQFDVEVQASAPLGNHRVVISLLTRTDSGEIQSLDTFSINLEVVESEEGLAFGMVTMGVLVLVGLMAIAILLRRKA